MNKKYKVITLCGSTKFKDQFEKTKKRLALEGNIVFSLDLFSQSGDRHIWENLTDEEILKTKELLINLHKGKIDLSDEIFVINVNGYIGETTRDEIEYAKKNGKIIKYLEPNI